MTTFDFFMWLTIFCLAVLVIIEIYKFIKLPREQQINNIKEWLKYAVVEAEKYYGSGTGAVKLRYVYTLAVEKFPVLAQFVSFETFSEWVDDALKWMEIQLTSNKAIQNLVRGNSDGNTEAGE